MPSSRLWRVLLALLLLAALFCVPSLVLTGSEWLPELTGEGAASVPDFLCLVLGVALD